MPILVVLLVISARYKDDFLGKEHSPVTDNENKLMGSVNKDLNAEETSLILGLKLMNYGEHNEFETSGLSSDDINNLIKNKELYFNILNHTFKLIQHSFNVSPNNTISL